MKNRRLLSQPAVLYVSRDMLKIPHGLIDL